MDDSTPLSPSITQPECPACLTLSKYTSSSKVDFSKSAPFSPGNSQLSPMNDLERRAFDPNPVNAPQYTTNTHTPPPSSPAYGPVSPMPRISSCSSGYSPSSLINIFNRLASNTNPQAIAANTMDVLTSPSWSPTSQDAANQGPHSPCRAFLKDKGLSTRQPDVSTNMLRQNDVPFSPQYCPASPPSEIGSPIFSGCYDERLSPSPSSPTYNLVPVLTSKIIFHQNRPRKGDISHSMLVNSIKGAPGPTMKYLNSQVRFSRFVMQKLDQLDAALTSHDKCMKAFLESFVKAEKMVEDAEGNEKEKRVEYRTRENDEIGGRTDGERALSKARKNLELVLQAQNKIWKAREGFGERAKVDRPADLGAADLMPWHVEKGAGIGFGHEIDHDNNANKGNTVDVRGRKRPRLAYESSEIVREAVDMEFDIDEEDEMEPGGLVLVDIAGVKTP